ncbi:fumarylacetoacetate hydrolase family protein [Cognatiyoonia sp.]|uniref:fumarylacetoacetate hydrolase family protein n=1 Tax=Cognatiyoonia sp. TaxID=2211652 RepID=UPI003F69C678
MSKTIFEVPVAPLVSIHGSDQFFPLGRIFCVGQNYAAHATEMGSTADYEAPFYFTKSPASVVLSGATIPYALKTTNLHHEMEFAVYLSGDAFEVTEAAALDAVYGYGCSLDLTRRDLQIAAKDKQRPWSVAKDFEDAAVLAPITPKEAFGAIDDQRIALTVNGDLKQDSTLDDLIHSVPAIIADLSTFYHLRAGDVILTGTPAGVGPLVLGDTAQGTVDGLEPVSITIA